MGQAEFKEKLGNRGKIKGEKTFNTSSGVSGNNKNSPQTTWEGTTKGATTHKKGK
mgnify:CR=1 FL=1